MFGSATARDPVSTKISPRHEAARNFAAAGYPIFPCLPDSKRPATETGFHESTTDLDQIDKWWSVADYNVALCPEDCGWAVIDADVGSAPLVLPSTYSVRTPRGGHHYYFMGSIRSTVGKLAPHVDTRGRLGYVLVPPSIVEGKPYVATDDREPEPLPHWVHDTLDRSDRPLPGAPERIDEGGQLARARTHLAHLVELGQVAVSGRGGNSRTYRLACDLRDLGCSPEKSVELLAEIWNPACIPPWDIEDLHRLATNANSYGQNEPGAHTIAAPAEVFADAVAKLLAEPQTEAKRSRFHMEDENEMEEGKEQSWLIQNLIPAAGTVLFYGPSRSFKSFIALAIALCASTNTAFCGAQISACGPVFYGALEGQTGTKKKRRRAWKLVNGLNNKPLLNFFVGLAPHMAFAAEVQAFGDEIKRRSALVGAPPSLIVIDTLSKAMLGLDDNSATDANRFVMFCDSLVETFGCSVIAIGHTGKDTTRGHRGSGALHAGMDTVIEIKRQGETNSIEIWAQKHKDAEDGFLFATMEGKDVGGTLVFQHTTAAEHAAGTRKHDPYDRQAVGAALKALGGAVTSTVLAEALTPALASESAEERQAAIAKAARALASSARPGGPLEAYATRTGRELLWSLPSS